MQNFEKRIEEVTEGVYVAIGYALANSILIEAPEGNIVIDATEDIDVAHEIKSEFKKLSNRPLLALIYTHAHRDHILGASALVEKGTEVYAHRLFQDVLFKDQLHVLRQVMNKRNIRQFGVKLTEEKKFRLHSRWDPDKTPDYVLPNRLFEGEQETTVIAGQTLTIFHAPGETDDHIYIWLPDRKILFCGDNYYMAFPNLYAIRGSYRPVLRWIAAIDKMRDLEPDFLVPSHGYPLIGAERISTVLTAYRDAIQYIHDAVIRGANDGKTPDELIEEIHLPQQLTSYPFLKEDYGRISLSIRAIYQSYLGVFDGNATNLDPLSPKERAQRIIDLIGSRSKLADAARQALTNGDYQWAAEIADMLLALDSGEDMARNLKAEALAQMGMRSRNMNVRYYYLTQAAELQKEVDIPDDTQEAIKQLAPRASLDKIFGSIVFCLAPAAMSDMADKEITVGFKTTDTEETYRMVIRRGVAEARSGLPKNQDLLIQVSSQVLKEISLGLNNLSSAWLNGQLKISGSITRFQDFASLFEHKP